MTNSRFRQIADNLRERVALGEFGDQGALDSESVLCARYGVSRVTVRRALETLREHGLVESRQGSGWFATGGSFHQTLALGTFRHAGSAVAESGKTMVRRVVEFGYRQASPALASTLALTTDRAGAGAGAGAGAAAGSGSGSDVAGEMDSLHCRSLRAVDGVPLDIVAEWVPAAIAGRLSRADAANPGIWASLQRDGHRVASVRQTITAGIASADDAALLNVTIGSPLLLVRRLALDQEKRPLALSDHRYLAHRFSLEVEFNGWPVAGGDTPPGLRERAAEPPVIVTDLGLSTDLGNHTQIKENNS